MTVALTRTQKPKIPITVLTGFLGSGKTTLLNYILNHNQGLKIGVVVNDFGSINIDAKLVTKQTDTMMELSNGCICCSVGSLDLQDAIGQFVYPDSPIDYIVIEASGLAEPRDLLESLRDSMSFDVRLDSIVGLIDAVNIEKNARDNPIALAQAEYSDFVIINKIDLVSKEKLADIHQLITSINPRARIFDAMHGEIDLDLILDTQPRDEPDSGPKAKKSDHSHHDHKGHAHEAFSHFSFESSKPLDPFNFQTLVNKELPTSIYRAKGFVNLGYKGHDRKYVFQLVGSRASIEWENWNDMPVKTELVFIGREVDEADVRRRLEACIDPEPDGALPQGYEVRLPKKAD